MPTIHLSYTSPINPPSTTVTLRTPQIWAGLQRKVRFAQEFVPVIESCTVLEERDDGTVVRDVVFKPGAGPKPRAREVVKEFWPSWVCFPIFSICYLMFPNTSSGLTRHRSISSRRMAHIFGM